MSECHFCAEEFAVYQDMRSHVFAQHFVDKRYFCRWCHERFVKEIDWKQHRITLHAEIEYVKILEVEMHKARRAFFLAKNDSLGTFPKWNSLMFKASQSEQFLQSYGVSLGCLSLHEKVRAAAEMKRRKLDQGPCAAMANLCIDNNHDML
jgi:hypothetical protein